MLEKYAKMTINFNLSLDTSSQDPKEYSLRFIEFCKKIFNSWKSIISFMLLVVKNSKP